MPYIVLWGTAYDLLADAIEANGGKAYKHYESIEEAGHDSPFTSVRNFGTLFIAYEHPEAGRDRSLTLPVPEDAEAIDQAACQIVDFAEHPG